jgi:hypothetical protein
MNLKYLPMRVELSFWHFVIQLLTDSRGIQSLLAWMINGLKPRLAVLMRTFNRRRVLGWIASGLVLSIFLGLGNNSLVQGLAMPGYVPPPLSPPATGQRNLLVIGIDDLSSPSPRLESVWLVSYFPGHSVFTLFPIYPDILENGKSDRQALAKDFSLDAHDTPNQAFFDLMGRETWWNNYLVIDEAGWAAILDFLGGVISDGRPLDGSGARGSLTLWGDLLASLHAQTELLQAACLRAAALRQEEAIQGLSLLAPHVRSDLDLTQDLRDGSTETGSRLGLRCEFPLTYPPEP